jgi:predicted ATPase
MKEFAPFRLDTVNQCVWRRRDDGGDERIRLTPKAFDVLRHLVERAGQLVTQDELLDAVWPDASVQPEVLKSQILDVRRALGDRPKNPLFIDTVPRRGYRFIAAVKDASAAEPPSTPEQACRTPVGRHAPLDQLSGSLQKALGRQRQVVFVTGDPGLGKTALVDEFQRRLGADGRSIRLGRGQCVEGYGGTEAYYPMLEALGQLCRGPEAESVVRILATQAPSWLVQFPALIKAEQRERLEREILGATRERMLREISVALESIAYESPLLLVFEDLQWVDPSTVDLISALARGRQPARLMLVGTYRPTDVAFSDHPLNALKRDLLIHNLCSEIALEPLGESLVAEYLAAQCGGGAAPEGLSGLIHRYTGGNPLFMVTVLEHLRERSLITLEPGNLKLAIPLEQIELRAPESLRQMIEIQIERLSEQEHRALEAASVTGAVFSSEVVAAAASSEVERFEELCEGLSRRHRIVRSAGSQEFPDGSVCGRYEFVHALYREVLYYRLSPGRRAKLHLQVAQRLEALYAQRHAEAAAELSHHFEQGGDPLRAIQYLQLGAGAVGRIAKDSQSALSASD